MAEEGLGGGGAGGEFPRSTVGWGGGLVPARLRRELDGNRQILHIFTDLFAPFGG